MRYVLFHGRNAIMNRLALLGGDYMRKLVKTTEEIERCMATCRHHTIANSFDPSNLCQPDIYDKLVDGFLEGVLRCS